MSSTRAAGAAFAGVRHEFDLHPQNTFGGEGMAMGWIASVDVRPLTDEQPRFHNGNTGSIFDKATGWVTSGSSRTLRVVW